MKSGLNVHGLHAALAPMAVAASVSTTVSLQVRICAHAFMIIALVDVCSRCVPSVSTFLFCPSSSGEGSKWFHNVDTSDSLEND